MKKVILLLIVFPLWQGLAKPVEENLRATFFFRSISNLSTAYTYVLTQVYNPEKKEFESRFYNAGSLFAAIDAEHQFGADSPFEEGWKRTIQYALKHQENGFVFEKPEALEQLKVWFNEDELRSCREGVESVGIEKVLFYLRGYRAAAHEEAAVWFKENGIDPSITGALPQVLYEYGYYPIDSNGRLTYQDNFEYRENLGSFLIMMLQLGVIDPQTPIVEPVGRLNSVTRSALH